MENQNENAGVQGTDLQDLKKMFNDYQKKQQSPSNKKSKEDLLAKYFVPRKPKEVFRILPPKAGKKHIEEAFFHVVTTNMAGGKKKYGTVLYCPAHNDPKVKKLDPNGNPILDSNGNPVFIPAPCPVCAQYKKLIASQDQSLKGVKKENMNDVQLRIKAKNDEIYKEAIKWEAKKFYIIRGIDRGVEKDSVKLFRFKHNYKNQGTLDKLLPILQEYMEVQQKDFSDPNFGCDLSFIMTDSEFNGHVYKTISAISARPASKLHNDPFIMRQWLEDDITWRDVYKPKSAPNITPYEYLEMVVSGNSPYWDDTDANNRHWVFPNRPDLQELANTRNRNLDANENDEYEYATDLDEEYSRVSISTMTESKVGVYKDDAVDLGAEILSNVTAETTSSDDYNDLPF